MGNSSTGASRWLRITDWFLRPERLDLSLEELRKARTTILIMLISLVVAPALVVPWIERGIPEIWVGSLTVLALIPGLLFLAYWKGSYKFAAHVLGVVYFYGFCAVLFFAGGLHGPAAPDFIMPGVMAVAISTRRAALFWLTLSVAAVCAAYVMANQGLLDLEPLPLAEMNKAKLSSAVVMIVAVFFFILSFDYTKERMRSELETEKERVSAARDALQLILNTTGQGFLTLDADGRVCGGWSEVTEEWFSKPEVGMYFPAYLEPIAPNFADTFELGWEQVRAGYLPICVSVDQLPERFRQGTRHFEVGYRPIADAADPTAVRNLVIIITDITAQVERDQARLRHKDLENLLERLIADHDGVTSFASESQRIVAVLDQGLPAEEQYRYLHTLKGICATWRLHNVARLCHELEDDIVALPNRALHEHDNWAEIRSAWEEIAAMLERFRQPSHDGVVLDGSAQAHLRDALVSIGEAATPLRQWFECYALEPARARLNRLASEAEALGERLGKRNMAVEIIDGDVRIDSRPLEELWSATTHLVRNAVDHGVPDDGGTITFELRLCDEFLVLEVRDDGPGIDWEAIRERARARRLPCDRREDLEQALFSDGFSTRSSASATSGRGVGLSAVRAAAEDIGATVSLGSAPGGGTRFRVRIPRSTLEVGVLPRPVALPTSCPRPLASPAA